MIDVICSYTLQILLTVPAVLYPPTHKESPVSYQHEQWVVVMVVVIPIEPGNSLRPPHIIPLGVYTLYTY